MNQEKEFSSCGVGFIASRKNCSERSILDQALSALSKLEHRGACACDGRSGDGSGIMTDIPWAMLGYPPGSVAVATLFAPKDPAKYHRSLKVFEKTFSFFELEVLDYRDVPLDTSILGEQALKRLPSITQAIIHRPKHCRTDEAFNKLLYLAKQMTRTKQKEAGIYKEFYFTSLSTSTIIYKGLTTACDLRRLYLDLNDPNYLTRFCLFHRRFSTNTQSTWDKAQPFRLIAHNGEINTISGNMSWSVTREKSLGLREDELLTRTGISDSGSLNEMVEALRYRSSIPYVEDILAIMIPPSGLTNPFYQFWSRAMEPWGGPALLAYCDGETIGARLDRNGFRPCRWALTQDHLYVASEAGAFEIEEAKVIEKGALGAGGGLTLYLESGEVHQEDPALSKEYRNCSFDARLCDLPRAAYVQQGTNLPNKWIYNYTEEDLTKVLIPMIAQGKEAIGSMGDTARLAVFSSEPRPMFDFFYQHFAQVTNPPVDYIRERIVMSTVAYLGAKPNIFETKELLPPLPGIILKRPILSLDEMAGLRLLCENKPSRSGIAAREFDTTFKRTSTPVQFKSAIGKIVAAAVHAVESGISIVVLSDRKASYETPAIPSLLILSAMQKGLDERGLRLKTSVVIETGEVRSAHHLACLIGFGATAVCPYLALEIARWEPHALLDPLSSTEKENNLLLAYETGLLRIMAKMGIAASRSYQGSRLFTPVGLGKDILDTYFQRTISSIGGIGLEELLKRTTAYTELGNEQEPPTHLPHTYQYKEHTKGERGEHHSMTSKLSGLAHRVARSEGTEDERTELYRDYLQEGLEQEPVNIRHLLALRTNSKLDSLPCNAIPMSEVESARSILSRFGSGAMSFGAISAEAQRDIFQAMRELGAKSNSGEGGDNPYYEVDATSASIKQVASGRFGVTARYLISGEEIEIKIAQGAKPGEGGQLMRFKVNEQIAKARMASAGIDLISPPPMHDIYSIEDLKELIYELKQLHPQARVGVKLVSGANIGTIATGVVKAGADIIQISGYDGGTGAAALGSMKHAGLPWEIGLVEVDRTLRENGLRHAVSLRVDGGLRSGSDIVIAAILGAEEFFFGKLMLVAQGCIMARVCEKNTCPTGIATHDPKFKAKYKGTKEHIINFFSEVAEDVRRHLADLGIARLADLNARTDLLVINPRHESLVGEKDLDLTYFLTPTCEEDSDESHPFAVQTGELNTRILSDVLDAMDRGVKPAFSYAISSSDRAIPASLAGALARKKHEQHLELLASSSLANLTQQGGSESELKTDDTSIDLTLTGSAGQGFAVFLVEGINVVLFGEANDSVAKAMSGGRVVIRPRIDTKFDASQSVIIGNCALYGATGGTLYVYGQAGDRFAVRNSGAVCVVEGVGMHACEYMTRGTVVILGQADENIGAGMTGGIIYMSRENAVKINRAYVQTSELERSDIAVLKNLLADYLDATRSDSPNEIPDHVSSTMSKMVKCEPITNRA